MPDDRGGVLNGYQRNVRMSDGVAASLLLASGYGVESVETSELNGYQMVIRETSE